MRHIAGTPHSTRRLRLYERIADSKEVIRQREREDTDTGGVYTPGRLSGSGALPGRLADVILDGGPAKARIIMVCVSSSECTLMAMYWGRQASSSHLDMEDSSYLSEGAGAGRFCRLIIRGVREIFETRICRRRWAAAG